MENLLKRVWARIYGHYERRLLLRSLQEMLMTGYPEKLRSIQDAEGRDNRLNWTVGCRDQCLDCSVAEFIQYTFFISYMLT